MIIKLTLLLIGLLLGLACRHIRFHKAHGNYWVVIVQTRRYTVRFMRTLGWAPGRGDARFQYPADVPRFINSPNQFLRGHFSGGLMLRTSRIEWTGHYADAQFS